VERDREVGISPDARVLSQFTLAGGDLRAEKVRAGLRGNIAVEYSGEIRDLRGFSRRFAGH